jgi:hypothetical protein
MVDLSKIVLKDSSGKPSVTVTAFVVGFLVASAKLLVSGMTLGSLTLSQFSGVDFAAAITALGGIYVLRRSQESSKKSETTDEKVD